MRTIAILSVIVFLVSYWFCLYIPKNYGKGKPKTITPLIKNVFLTSVICCLVSLIFLLVSAMAYLFQLILS